MMPCNSAPELRPRAPCPLHPLPERHGDQTSNSPPGFNGLDGQAPSGPGVPARVDQQSIVHLQIFVEVQAQLCHLQHAYNFLCLPQKSFAVIKMMLQSNERDENVAPPFAFQPEPQVLHAGYDFHSKSTSSTQNKIAN
ncbi:hypothetical protein NW760_014574 [Fusarium oxysporum]|uniref:Uncharacterized protein n=1 Tax=Fusarium oxysporum f. sp. raphani TaxID=96318 RepID=A0A8J5PVN5_FUSOX|nr:hypothetical protein Forpi1262_v011214 [Fusarium oxysporum f. sp. raphani]KAJ4103856.1 hypothetical protein NW769_009547 [Fusarium oxysporum]KAJ4214851.1 hypothetical protein NW760_014574 [Fusarium oxysporum]